MYCKYSYMLKKEVSSRICDNGESTSLMAKEYGIPLKTVEKWVTAYNKDRTCYDKPDNYYSLIKKTYNERYDEYGYYDLIRELKKRDAVIEYLVSVIKVKNKKD